MDIDAIWNIAQAILLSLGGGAAIVFAFSTWLGKVWAERILEKDRAKYQREIELIKGDLNKKIHEHNVAVSRIDAQRADAVQQLYAQLLNSYEVVLNIIAPNNFIDHDAFAALPQYQAWASEFREETEKLEKLSTQMAIYLGEDTYMILARCSGAISMLSIDFCNVVFGVDTDEPLEHVMAKVIAGKETLKGDFDIEFKPAKDTLLTEFRTIMDPRLDEVGNK